MGHNQLEKDLYENVLSQKSSSLASTDKNMGYEVECSCKDLYLVKLVISFEKLTSV